MIPAYSEEVKITVKEPGNKTDLEPQVRQLQEQVRQLIETVEYMNRERSRLKADIDILKSKLNK
jgi:phage shock protein A